MGSFKTTVMASAFCALVATAAGSGPSRATGTQNNPYLDRRISTLEQRFYTIESRIGSIEQQMIAARRSTTSGSARDPLVDQLRSEIATLQARLRELECGLVRVDERTLPASAKSARPRGSAEVNDPCRQNTQAPVRLTTRQ